jgi:mannose-6-phosphate isomerase-like protein (cupin superfamily)
VTDDVHFHHVDFQLLAVRRGWVDVEYAGWGERLRMEVGDVVLQPPGIRHQVIETSAGFEIIEVGSPADHLTEFDPNTTLPDAKTPGRTWNGQPFVFSTEADRATVPWDYPGFSAADTGIGAATHGAVEVRQVRVDPDGAGDVAHPHSLRLIVVMEGSVSLQCAHVDDLVLGPGDAVTLPADSAERFYEPSDDCWLLDVTTPTPG